MDKRLREIDEQLNGLQRSVGLHYRWLVQVFRLIAQQDRDPSDVLGLEAHNACDFGHWLNHYLERKSEDRGFLLAINEKHIAVHNICRQLVDSILQGKIKEALFNDFEHALQGFISAATAYQAHLLQLRISYDTLTGCRCGAFSMSRLINR